MDCLVLFSGCVKIEEFEDRLIAGTLLYPVLIRKPVKRHSGLQLLLGRLVTVSEESDQTFSKLGETSCVSCRGVGRQHFHLHVLPSDDSQRGSCYRSMVEKRNVYRGIGVEQAWARSLRQMANLGDLLEQISSCLVAHETLAARAKREVVARGQAKC